ncbi:MAG: redoxin domain-containing protein [Fimbriimonadaceae bacterium]|nr:redoxin domain-containing protein [Fimbriimonadaceae bacterium]
MCELRRGGRPRTVVGRLWAGLALLLLAAPQSPAQDLPAVAGAADRVEAPEFPSGLEWLNVAAPLRLADLRGKVVLLDFWTSCCINCLHILPELAKLEAKYADELVVVGVHSAKFTAEGQTANIAQAIRRYEIAHPVLNDLGFQVWQQYRVRAWPTFVLLGPDSRVVGTQAGELTFEDLDPLIAAQVQQASAAGTLRRGPLPRRLERDRAPRSVLLYPGKVLADAPGRRLFIADSTHHRYLVTDLDGRVQTVIGSGAPGFDDGDFATATFRQPQGVALVGATLYLADTANHALRVADLTARRVTTLVGTGRKPTSSNRSGRGRQVALHSPWEVLPSGAQLLVANAGSHQLWLVDPRTAEARPWAGSGREDLRDGPRLSPGSDQPDPVRTAALAQPSGLASAPGRVYFVDSETSSLRYVDLARGTVQTLVGRGLFDFGAIDGPYPQALMQHPLGLAVVGDSVFVADTFNSRIRRFHLPSGQLNTFAGGSLPGDSDGLGAAARFDGPAGLSAAAGRLYVADTNNHAIRVVDLATAAVSTLLLREPERARPPQGAGRPPQTVVLPPATVRPGAGRLRLRARRPAGFQPSPCAPLRVSFAESPLLSGARSGPLPADELLLTFVAGQGRLAAELDVYLCRSSGHGACFFESLRLELPLTVAASAPGHDLSLTVDLPPPGG